MHFNYWTEIDKTKLLDSDFEKVQTMVNYLDDEEINIFIIMAVLVSVQWVWSLWVFQVSKFFGPLIKILMYMLINIWKFMIIYLTIFFIFSCAFSILFTELENFSTLHASMRKVLMYGMGQFDFSDFDKVQNLSPQIGYILLGFYIIISCVVLLNFIIAILSDTYNGLSLKS